MWQEWAAGKGLIALATIVWTLAWALPLAQAAYRLPRALDPQVVSLSASVRRKRQTLFCVLAMSAAGFSVWRFGATIATAAVGVYILTLLSLAWIDAETGYLPDALTLPLLWLGLLVNVGNTFTELPDAVIGAAAGYSLLWLLNAIYTWRAGRQGMGHGDMKLVAALGAWLGWAPLPKIVLAASVAALCIMTLRRLAGRLPARGSFSFGPYLAGMGVIALFVAAA